MLYVQSSAPEGCFHIHQLLKEESLPVLTFMFLKVCTIKHGEETDILCPVVQLFKWDKLLHIHII